jgi:hypothetical protein
MNLSDLSRNAQASLSTFARDACIILARKRGQRGGHSIKPISVYKLRYKGIDKLVDLLEDGWRIVKR